MEVTTDNFSETLPVVRSSLQQESACFCAFDLEFTGLSSGQESRDTDLDSMQDRYLRAKNTAQSFLVLQFGLSVFHLRRGRYEAETFTFYTFPRPCRAARTDRRFTCQASSVAFLMQNGFSFDKCFGKGITSLPLSQAEAALGNAEAAAAPQQQRRVQITSERDRNFVDELQANLNGFLSSDQRSLKLFTPNGYFRLVARQQIESFEQETQCFLHVESDSGNLTVTKVTKEQKVMYKLMEEQQRNHAAEEAVGFSRVVEAVGRSGLPLVGHNMLLDIAYTMEHFVEPLPPTWLAFKGKVGSFFTGGIYDTKYLCGVSTDLFPAGTGLAQVYQALSAGTDGRLSPDMVHKIRTQQLRKPGSSGAPTVSPVLPVAHAGGFVRYQEIGQSTVYHHEAGFDAFMTGTVFSRLLWLAKQLKTPEQQGAENPEELLLASMSSSSGKEDGVGGGSGGGVAPASGETPGEPFSVSPLIKYANRICLFRGSAPYTALAGPDPAADKPHVVHVSGIRPGTISNQNIWDALNHLNLGRVRINWIDGGSSCFLVLLDGQSQGGTVAEHDIWRHVQLGFLNILKVPVRAQKYIAWERQQHQQQDHHQQQHLQQQQHQHQQNHNQQNLNQQHQHHNLNQQQRQQRSDVDEQHQQQRPQKRARTEQQQPQGPGPGAAADALAPTSSDERAPSSCVVM